VEQLIGKIVRLVFIPLLAALLNGRAAEAQEVNPAPAQIPSRSYSLLQFGGVGDGRTLNTRAFARAAAVINAVGGGKLVVPAGVFLTQPFSLVSGMELHLDAGAVIQFPHDLTSYGLSPQPTARQMKALKGENLALIGGHDLTDVAITGSGIIDGGGSAWWTVQVPDKEGRMHDEGSSRPKMIIFTNVRRLHVQGVTLRNSPRYHLVLHACRDVTIEGVHITAPADSPNTDGIDPIASENVLIRDCDLDVGDDDIAIKAIEGPAANILIDHCRCKNGRGISIGSETYKGIHDVTVRDGTFDGTVHGIHIKSARDRGSQLYGFHFSNITMKNVAVPLSINLYYEDKAGAADRETMPVTGTTPFVHDVQIDGLTVTGADSAGEIIGLPESPVKDVTLTNVKISAGTGMKVRDAQGVVFKNVDISAESGEAVMAEFADVTQGK
jgi:polygalacturonase